MAARSSTLSTRGLALALLIAATAATLSSAFLNPSLASRRLLQPAQRALPATRQAGVRMATAMMSAGGKEWALIFDCDGVILEVR